MSLHFKKGQMAIPTVFLDWTLSEFFAAKPELHEEAVLVYFFTKSTFQIIPSLPIPRKYLNNDPPFLQEDAISLTINCKTYPEHMGFVAGNIPLYYVAPPETDDGGSKSLCTDSWHVYNMLREDQRPDARCIPDLSKIVLSVNDRIVRIRAEDCLAHFPAFVDSDVQYELATKKTLAISGIPTPKTDVIDSIIGLGQTLDDDTVKNEVSRIVAHIKQRELPFVVKLQNSAGSGGTFLVRTAESQDKCVEVVAAELYRTLWRLNPENYKFQPASIIIQEFVPGDAIGISFFVTREGQGIFLGACRQLFNENDLWIGGGISYQEQDRIQHESAHILETVAQFVHAKGYYGPCGIDVMIDASGTPLVIDLNPRSTGALPLCSLRQHFSIERGLHEAVLLLPIVIACTRTHFTESLAEEISHGQIVITSWTYVSQKQCSVASMLVAAKTLAELQPVLRKIHSFEASQ